MLRFQCPRCHSKIEVQNAATVVTCKSCGQSARVPAGRDTEVTPFLKQFAAVGVAAFTLALICAGYFLFAGPGERQNKPIETERPAEKPPAVTPAIDPLDQAIADLGSADRDARLRAAEAIGARGAGAARAAGPLCRAVAREFDEPVRSEMLEALDRSNPDLYPPVVAFVIDGDPRKLVKELGRFESLGSRAKPACEFLVVYAKNFVVPTANDGHALLRMGIAARIVAVIRQQNPSVPGFADLLIAVSKCRDKDIGDPAGYKNIMHALRVAYDNAPADREKIISHLTDLLASSDEETAADACANLGAIGPDAKWALPKLKEAKASGSARRRIAAAEAIRLIEK